MEETVQKGKAITEICNYRKTGKKKTNTLASRKTGSDRNEDPKSFRQKQNKCEIQHQSNERLLFESNIKNTSIHCSF